jgi:single-strand DNA-binding protein
MRYTPSGQAVTQFTVAVNRNYKDNQGEWQEETEWFRVVAWGPLAERTAENLRKGRKVYVEGRIQTRQWEDQSGQKRYTTELIAQTVSALDRRPDDASGERTGGERVPQPVAAGGGGRAGGEGREGAEGYADDLDDLPF